MISLAGASAPDFWVAITGILVFAVTLGWLPTSGTGTPWHWIMPIAVLLIRPFGLLVQVVRGAMISALSSAYVKTARAKGVRERSVIFVHALRNATLPVITVAGDQAAGIVNGAVIVETVFGFPGVGKLMIDAITQRDFAIIQAAILVTAIAIFVMNILIDLAYAVLDPRIRHSVSAGIGATPTALPPLERPWRAALALLWRDKVALVAALYLVLVVVCGAGRPGAARGRREQDEPARPQRAAVHARSRLAVRAGRRCARPQHPRADHRRGAEHARGGSCCGRVRARWSAARSG